MEETSLRGSRSAAVEPDGRGLLAAVEEASAVFGELGGGFARVEERLRTSADRLRAQEFRVAVVGQFKRGKSTLLNALLGEEVLPAAILPLTAVPTLLVGAPRREIAVVFRSGRSPEKKEFADAASLRRALAEYVTEKENPENSKEVTKVLVGHPAPVLASGIVLVDTPGIGSTLRHNTRTTMDFLPECDAALFVVSPEPPLTEVEIEFVRTLKPGAVRLFVLLNKVDMLAPADSDDLVEFLRESLAAEADLTDVTVHRVSARDGLAARAAGDPAAWRASGVAAVEDEILRPLAGEKSRLLLLAIGRKAADSIEEGTSRARLAVRALRLPIEELDARLARLHERVEAVKDQAKLVLDLVDAEKRRALAFLEEQATELKERGHAHFGDVVDRALGETAAETPVRKEIAAAVPPFFDREHVRMRGEIRDYLATALKPHQERAEALVAEIGKAAEDLFEVPVRVPESREAFRMREDVCWSREECVESLSPIPAGWIDAVLPAALRRRRVRARMLREVSWIVVRNVENLRWTAHQSIRASVDDFMGGLRIRLEEVAEATEGAVWRARARQEEGAESVEADVARIEAAIDRLDRLRDRVSGSRRHRPHLGGPTDE